MRVPVWEKRLGTMLLQTGDFCRMYAKSGVASGSGHAWMSSEPVRESADAFNPLDMLQSLMT